MKCKRHPQVQGTGVCATCLRDRLLALKAVEDQTSPELRSRNPRPISPHSADSSLASDYDRQRRFYCTPQVGDRRSDRGCRRSIEPEARALNSWFSSLIHGRRKKEQTPRIKKNVRSFRISDRGMSPVRCEKIEDDASDSGYSTESSTTRQRPTPARKAAAERHRRNGGGLAGFVVCLSPLVRPGPASRRSQPPELGFSCDLRSGGNPMRSRHVPGSGSSLGINRSRKLADRGRFR